MLTRRHLLQAAAGVGVLAPFFAKRAWAVETFDSWLVAFKVEALAAGISQATLDSAMTNLKPIDKVIELDRDQPEFTSTFWDYLGKRVVDKRIAEGQVKLSENKKLLKRVEADYGLQPHYLMAFWGLETNFGSYMGDFPVIDALATLAWDERRSAFFRSELLDALTIIDQGHITARDMVGSWAGAMGHFQFLPSTFLAHATDADGDGRKNIWSSLDDAFASAGKYLADSGWNAGQPWGHEVLLPDDFPWEQADVTNLQPVSTWAKLGVKRANGGKLKDIDAIGALVLPAGWQGPAFLALNNFLVILEWNNSWFYAISVGHLADRIDGAEGFRAKAPASEERLTRDEITAMQGYLTTLGYDTGKADGKVGPNTRKALRAWQKAQGLPADAFPTKAIIEQLKKEAA